MVALEAGSNEKTDTSRAPGVPSPYNLEGIRRENQAKAKGSAYSQETLDIARTLWIGGWSDARIAKALGMPRRETITEWSLKQGWAAVRADYQRRVVVETNARSAVKLAEANAQYLTQIRGSIAFLLRDLTARTASGELTLRSLEGAAFALARLVDVAREIEGLRQSGDSPVLIGQVNVQNNVAVTNVQQMLEKVRGDPARTQELLRLQNERLTLEARLRTLTEQPVVSADTESDQDAGDATGENA